MADSLLILNEREAREAKATVTKIDRALSSDEHFASIITGLPLELVDRFRRALRNQKDELETTLKIYESTKTGEFSDLIKRSANDIGVSLIVARIIKGYSQKQLSRRLGIKEQQIQRYEADRYRSISISNYKRIAHALGARLELSIPEETDFWRGGRWELTSEYSAQEIKKVFKHARRNNWFKINENNTVGEESYTYLQRYVSDHFLKYGSPTLLRTGMNIDDLSDDFALVAWKARVTKLAEGIIETNKVTYRILDISWLIQLVQLSQHEEGPAKARELLLSNGIVMVTEPQIPGLKLDGAAFLVDGVPVIGLTLRRDTIDNFWFTLLHEVAHIILHYRMGLGAGFFDDTDRTEVEEEEQEANEFASNLLIPNEKWKRSPARISKSEEIIKKFAGELNIHPAIVFGRIQKERGNYAKFSNKLGRGLVRKWLI